MYLITKKEIDIKDNHFHSKVVIINGIYYGRKRTSFKNYVLHNLFST